MNVKKYPQGKALQFKRSIFPNTCTIS